MELRPATLDEYIGQKQAKSLLNETMPAAKRRGEPVKHMLLTGAPGIGKTSLAGIIANYMGGKLIVTTGMNLKTAEEIYKVLLTLRPQDILFVDELHELRTPEALYRAVEDGVLELNVTQGKAQTTISVKLPRFTLIGATTDPSDLPKPLRDRMDEIHLFPYTAEEMFQIVTRSFKVRELEASADTVNEVVKRSRSTPRIANAFVSTIKDMAENRGESVVGKEISDKAFSILGIDNLGLTELDRKYLRTIITKYDGGKVGIDTLAASMGEDRNSLCKMVEPYLLSIGLIEVMKGGRTATQLAYKHLNMEAI